MERQERSSDRSTRAAQIEDLLTNIDKTSTVPPFVREEPGLFLRNLYDAWHHNGGVRAGKYHRNNIRTMRNDWLVGPTSVKSLHPKLMGRQKISMNDSRHLIDLFLLRWRYDENSDKISSHNQDGYISFPSIDCLHLRNIIVSAMFSKKQSFIFIPRRSITRFTDRHFEDVRKDIIASKYRNSRALITSSRNKSVIGVKPSIGIGGFIRFLDMFYDEDQKLNGTGAILIWIIDIGRRLDGDDTSFKRFLNVSMLASRFIAFANFDSLDRTSSDRFNIYHQMIIANSESRYKKWSWLNKKAVIVMQNLRKEEIQMIKNRKCYNINVRKTSLVTEQHVLPYTMPNTWTRPIRESYKKSIEGVSDVSIGIAIRKEPNELNKYIEYRAYAGIVEHKENTNEDDKYELIDLPSPGESYDEALRLVYSAAQCALEENVAINPGKKEMAIEYLRLLDFEILTIEDFIDITMSYPKWNFNINGEENQ